ncbi:MAG TPA: HIT family protein [Longimicrobium sp.]|jgi:histidine triad (HIT) family protein
MCLFCRIARGESPSSIVYQDDACIAFMDLYPVRPGHLLVIPRRHAVHLRDLPAAEQAHLFGVAMRLMEAQRAAGYAADAANLLVNDGAAAGQQVPHVHLHLVPRTRGDGVGVMGAFLSRVVHFARHAGRRARLDAAAARIREHLP